MSGKFGFKRIVVATLVAAGLGLAGCGTGAGEASTSGGAEGAMAGLAAKLQSGFHKALPRTSSAAAPTRAPSLPGESPAASGPVDYAEWDRQLERASATGWMPGRSVPDRGLPQSDAARPRTVALGIPGFEGIAGVSSFGQAP